MCSVNPICRFCTGHGQRHVECTGTYASVLVGDVGASVAECEAQFAPSFTTWCMQCERLSFMCLGAFEDFYPECCLVVNGPLTRQQAHARGSSFEAQVVLWRQMQALALNASE